MALACAWLLPSGAAASIAYDTVSSATTSAAAATLSWTHTIGSGFFRLLTVSVAVEDASSTDCVVTGVTYNGVALTQANSVQVTSTSVYQCVSLWYLLEASLPAAGSYTVSVTTNATNDDITAGANSFTGVRQVAPQATATNSCTSCSNAISTSITTTLPRAWLVDAIGCGNTGSYTATGTNQNERHDLQSLSSSGASSTTATTAAGTQSVSWTHTNANRLGHVVAAFFEEPTTTIAFQDGVAPTGGYSGTTDTYIDSGAPTTNFGTADPVQLDSNGDAIDPNQAVLIKFDVSQIPANSVVLSATLIVNSVNATAGSFPIYRLLRNWSGTEATWNVYATGSSWTTAGAQGAGTDYFATSLGSVTGGTGSVSIALNASGVAVVQGWVNGTISNFGLLIQNYAQIDGFDFSADDTATAANRPRLVVTYRRRRVFVVG
jgi:hypothetical protein